MFWVVCCFSSFLFFLIYNGLFKKKKEKWQEGLGNIRFGKTPEIPRKLFYPRSYHSFPIGERPREQGTSNSVVLTLLSHNIE